MKKRFFCFFSLSFFYIFNKKTLNSAACKKSFPFYVPSRERNVDEWRESCNSEAPSEALNALLTQANISLAHSSKIHFFILFKFPFERGKRRRHKKKRSSVARCCLLFTAMRRGSIRFRMVSGNIFHVCCEYQKLRGGDENRNDDDMGKLLKT